MLNLPDQPLHEALSAAADGDGRYGRVEQLAALLDVLDVGLVSVDAGGNFANVNRAASELLGIPSGNTTATEFARILRGLAERALNHDEATEQISAVERDRATKLKTTWAFDVGPSHLGVVSQPAPFAGFDGRIWAFYDNSMLAEAIEAGQRAATLVRASSDAMLDPQVLLEAVRDSNGRIVDFTYRDANPATARYLGMKREALLGRSVLETMPNTGPAGLIDRYAECIETRRPLILDNVRYDNEILSGPRRYEIRANNAGDDLLALTWRDVTDRFETDQRIALSEERFRLLADNMADVVVRIHDGRISWISKSVQNALNAPPEYWIGRKVIDFVAPEEQDTYRSGTTDIADGGTSLGRLRVLGADEVRHWVHLHAKPFHEADGTPNGLVVSFRLIDDEVAAETQAQEQISQRDVQNRSLTHRLQEQKDRLLDELKSAARYVESILPGDLDGPVRVSSRYVPSLYLGGDSYDYYWVDHDHLVFYLLDVSGHGVESAMLSVSVQNMLRSGTLSQQKLLQPAVVLSELNRVFQMDQQRGNYFTIWYGVYQSSTRRLRYACGGHPPAIAFAPGTDGVTPQELAAPGLPIGMFEETQFATGNHVVAPNTQIVLYSDGAFELDPEAGRWDPKDFTALCTRMAASPDWSVDDLIAELAAATTTGFFDDDCTVVRLIFD